MGRRWRHFHQLVRSRGHRIRDSEMKRATELVKMLAEYCMASGAFNETICWRSEIRTRDDNGAAFSSRQRWLQISAYDFGFYKGRTGSWRQRRLTHLRAFDRRVRRGLAEGAEKTS